MSIVKAKLEKGILCWFALTVVSLGVAGWFIGKFSVEWYRYHQLASESCAQVHAWGINEVKKGNYAIYAKYSFENLGQILVGKTVFKLKFNNEIAAHATLEDWKKQQWTVYFNPNNPRISTLQRPFPLKELVHGLIGLAALFYFLFLKRYASSFNSQQS